MSERNEPVDPRHEEALARALQAHAETVQPIGDGLVQIRARVSKRRVRHQWMAPAATAAAVAATVTVLVASGTVAGSHHTNTALDASLAATSTTVHKTPTPTPPAVAAKPTPATAPAVATTAPGVVASAPVATATSSVLVPRNVVASDQAIGPTPVWPFDPQEAANWQKGAAADVTSQWHLDANDTAVRFVQSLHLPVSVVAPTTPALANAGTADVTLSRTSEAGKPLPFAVVHLTRWAHGLDAPWGVVSISSPPGSAVPLTVSQPSAQARVAVPLAVTFSLAGAEDDVYVSAWKTGGNSALASQRVAAGGGRTVTLTSGLPSSGTGFVVVADEANGGAAAELSRLVVTPVSFGATTPTTATEYVAIADQRLNLYDATTDTEVHPLAGDASGVTQVAVSDDRQWVYYLESGAGTGVIMEAPMDGSANPTVVSPATADVTAFAIAGPHGEQLSYVTASPTGGQTISWSGPRTGSLVLGPSSPPDAQGLAISPDGTKVAAFIRTGTAGNVYVFNTATATSLNDGSVPAACGSIGNGCVGAAYAPDGDLVVVTSDGQSLTVERLHGSAPASTLFSVPDSRQLATVDLDPTGTQVLLTDGATKGWSWSGSGTAKPMPVPVSGASW